METKIVHLKKEPYDIRIDRSSIYGNPFVIGQDGNRKDVVRKCDLWLRGEDFTYFKQRKRRLILRSLHELKGKRLGCWCAPKPCHGDIYIKLLEEQANAHT